MITVNGWCAGGKGGGVGEREGGMSAQSLGEMMAIPGLPMFLLSTNQNVCLYDYHWPSSGTPTLLTNG